MSTTIKGGALIIHAGLLRARPDLNATLHTHTVAGMGVAAHKFGLLPINQHAIRFYGEMKYHEFEGFEFDHDMTPKLVRDLDGGAFLILRNHGVLVCGDSVAECVVNHHFLEMACQGQIAALAAGRGQLHNAEQGGLRIRPQPVHGRRQFPEGRQGLGGLPAPRRPARPLLQGLIRNPGDGAELVRGRGAVAEEFEIGRDLLEQHVGADLVAAAARAAACKSGVGSAVITTSPTKVLGTGARDRAAAGRRPSCRAAWR